MSEEKINLDPRVTLATDRWFLARGLGARVLTLTAEVRDLQHRFTALEYRFGALENRFTAMEARLSGIEGRLGRVEERMSAMLVVIVRVAERLDRTPQTPSG